MPQATRTAPTAQPSTRTRRWMLGSLVAAAAGAALTFGLAPDAHAANGPDSFKGKAAPDIALKTLAGDDVKLSDQKGKVVLVDFWATWCPPCRKGLPHVNEAAGKKEWKEKGLVVWAVNLQEKDDKVKKYVTDNNLAAFTVPLDAAGAAAKSYGIESIPTTLLIGRDGKVAEVFIGLAPAEEIDKAIEKALAAK